MPPQSEATLKLRQLRSERDELDALNGQLSANQAALKDRLAAAGAAAAEQAAQVVELKEQVHTVTGCIPF